jgi:PadR family transcriptional regulator, regulatory protein PadR
MKPNLGNASRAILFLLSDGKERYGLEMVTESNGTIKRGSVYVLLERMTDQKFVTSRRDEVEGSEGLPRRLYAITALGHRALRHTETFEAIWKGGTDYATT